jgi:hypothetical protein
VRGVGERPVSHASQLAIPSKAAMYMRNGLLIHLSTA